MNELLLRVAKTVVRKAYFALRCYEDDEHFREVAVLVDAAQGNDVVVAHLQEIAAAQGAKLGRTLRFSRGDLHQKDA